MNHYRTITAAIVGFVLANGSALALTKKPSPTVDWPRFIECRANFGEYNSFILGDFQDERYKARLKLRKIKQANPMLEEYELSEPITVYGYATRRIVFNAAGVMAVVDEEAPASLAEQLKLDVAYKAGNKILASKTLFESKPESIGETKVWQKISKDLSTVDSHPGKTLVGCTYRLMMKE